MNNVVNLYKGDCLTEHERIEDGSVDLILCDPPYGTVEGLGGGVSNHGMKGKTAWDMAIEPSDLFEIANRILRRNGKLVLFSQEPYTSRLITEAIPNLPFNYRMIWEKDHFANSLIAKKAPVSFYEDILVFSKRHELVNNRPISDILRKYQEDSKVFWDSPELIKELVRSGIAKNEASARVISKHKLDWNYAQFEFMTRKQYDLFNIFFNWRHSYESLKEINDEYNEGMESVFNLWEGGKYKSNILRYKKDYDGYHPTQKPVALLDDIIRTYSNEGDLIVDLTMGSGSTGVAAVKAGRRFTGIELCDEYFDIAERRISECLP